MEQSWTWHSRSSVLRGLLPLAPGGAQDALQHALATSSRIVAVVALEEGQMCPAIRVMAA